MSHRLALLLPLLLVPAARPAAGPPPDQWVAVVAPAFREAAAPLVAHRKAQGLRVAVVAPQPPAELRRTLAALREAHHGRTWVLLLGAVEADDPDAVVPAHPGSASRMLGQPTDAAYGCPDGTRLPAAAVGRLPARTEAEARAMVRKVIAFEQSPPGAWKRRLTVLAGIPAFNPVVDQLVESVAFARFERIDPAWAGQAVYTSPSSRFRLPGRLLRSKSLELLGRGQMVTLYLGHSDATGLYGGDAPFLSRADFASARMPHGGLFVTFGCLGCQLAGKDGEGYGVAAVRNPEGPVGVIGSHGICFAAMVQLASDGLFEKAFAGRMPARLGDCWLAALGGVAGGRIDFLSYRLLDAVDGDRKIPQATQRQEHLEMFVLLGDPATRLPAVDDDIDLTVPEEVTPGGVLRLRGTLPERLSGAAVEVVVERTPASAPEGPAAGEGVEDFERANRFEVARTTLLTRGRRFGTELGLPESLPWRKLIVRVRAATATAEAVTARRIGVAAEGAGR
ncbi:MAG: C25 family cysteine peptidase [Gemmataceae bacterium]